MTILNLRLNFAGTEAKLLDAWRQLKAFNSPKNVTERWLFYWCIGKGSRLSFFRTPHSGCPLAHYFALSIRKNGRASLAKWVLSHFSPVGPKGLVLIQAQALEHTLNSLNSERLIMDTLNHLHK